MLLLVGVDETQPRVDGMLSGLPTKCQKTGSNGLPQGLFVRFKEALLAFIINYQVLFLVVENVFSQDLIRLASPVLTGLILTENTIRAWIMAKYEQEKARVKLELLENSLGMIYVSFDL
jgi:hypothetical protein